MMAIVGSSGSPSCPVSRKLMVSLYCSLNMLEGDTGYASFLYFFHMDDVLVGHWIIKLSLKFRTKTLHLLPSKGILLIYNRYGVKRISVLCVCVCVLNCTNVLLLAWFIQVCCLALKSIFVRVCTFFSSHILRKNMFWGNLHCQRYLLFEY